MNGPVRDRQAMIAGMDPELDPCEYVFVTLPRGADTAGLDPLAVFHEQEGPSLILPRARAPEPEGAGPAMARITLRVHSALDGAGLTAAVATALAGAGIACNVVAAFHHDHLFVPTARAEEALEILRALARAAG